MPNNYFTVAKKIKSEENWVKAIELHAQAYWTSAPVLYIFLSFYFSHVVLQFAICNFLLCNLHVFFT